jgi:pilus assembly protein FimV
MLNSRLKKIALALRQTLSARSDIVAGSGWRIGHVLFVMVVTTPAYGIGFGDARVESSLGQPLRATLPLLGNTGTGKTAGCFSARLTSADGSYIGIPRITMPGQPPGQNITVTTAQPMVEPALVLEVEVGCGQPVVKSFSLLVDPDLSSPSSPLIYGMATQLPINQEVSTAEYRANPDAPRAGPALTKRLATSSKISPAPMPLPLPIPDNGLPAEAGAPNPKRNVLRMGSRGNRDIELMNSIGLRLALANQLSENTPATKNAIPDLAQSAANRAARAKFAAMMRNEPDAELVSQATEQKLQQLMAKMQILEEETIRLKQANNNQITAPVVASSPIGGDYSKWLPFAGALVALLLLSIGAIVWLLMRIQQLKRHQSDWDREVATKANTASNHDPVEPWFAHTSDDLSSQDSLLSTPTPAEKPAYFKAAGLFRNPFITPAPIVPAEQFLAEPSIGTPNSNVEAKSAKTSKFAWNDGSNNPPHAIDFTDSQGNVVGHSAEADQHSDDLHLANAQYHVDVVEQVSDLMQEAEFWMSIRDTKRAIDVLEPYTMDNQPLTPLPWLHLLKLYVDLDQRDKYDELKMRFHRIFNCRIPEWEEQKSGLPVDPVGGLDNFPMVIKKIIAVWHTESALLFFENLMMDDRDGTRAGFDMTTFKEIMFLFHLAAELQRSENLSKAVGIDAIDRNATA